MSQSRTKDDGNLLPRALSDFEDRLRSAPAGSVLRRENSVAILVHPTADNIELLQRIAWLPSRCVLVDCYWKYREEVYFVEIWAKEVSNRLPGVYYLFDEADHGDKFQVVLPTPVVTSGDVQRILGHLERVIDRGDVNNRRASGERKAVWLTELP
jgi:hypothetical protein